MATTDFHETQKRKHGIFAASSGLEGLLGLAVIVLTALGLANILPVTLACIAVIVLGAALLVKGGSIMARYTDLVAHYGSSSPEVTEFGGGTSVEFLGGITGIVLGILCLIPIATGILLPVSVIVFGAVLLISAGVLSRISHEMLVLPTTIDERLVRPTTTTDEPLVARRDASTMVEAPAIVRRETEEAMNAAAGMELFVGVGELALGILALIGFVPLTLVLVGLLAGGAAVFFSATSVGARMVGVFAH